MRGDGTLRGDNTSKGERLCNYRQCKNQPRRMRGNGISSGSSMTRGNTPGQMSGK